MLAISAALATPCRSSSAAQECASSAGSAGGIVQPSFASSVERSSDCPPSSSKKRREKKWMWPSATARSPLSGIRLVPMSNARGERELGEAGDVVDAQLLHHGLTVAADGLEPEVEQYGDVLAGLA